MPRGSVSASRRWLVLAAVSWLAGALPVRMPVREVAIEHQWVDNRRLVMSNGVLIGRHEAPLASGSIYATDIDGKRQLNLYGSRASDSGSGRAYAKPGTPDGHFYRTDIGRLDKVGAVRCSTSIR